jgi:hypothetical protein
MTKTPLHITYEAYQKMALYIEAASGEISGLGTITRTNELTVDDVFIFPQECGGAHTEIDMKDIANEMIRIDKEGGNTGAVKVWWHSHADMEAFFSGTDTDTIEEMGATFPYLVSIVGNKRGQFNARVDVFNPIRMTSEMRLEITHDNDVETRERIEQEVREKIHVPVLPSYNERQLGFDTYYGGYKSDKKLVASEANCYGQHVDKNDIPKDRWCWDAVYYGTGVAFPGDAIVKDRNKFKQYASKHELATSY